MTDDAIALHEIFTSLQQAGFTHDEALSLTAAVLVGQRDAMRAVRQVLSNGPDSPPTPGADS